MFRNRDFLSKKTWGPQPSYPNVIAKKGKFDKLLIIAGPCSVESHEQVDKVVPVLVDNGISYARGGVYRAGTYPREDFGLRPELASYWSKSCREKNLKVVMEILDIRLIETFDSWSDAFQVGARHMQDYPLLVELARSKKPVLLKRNMGATLDEFLGAAEYLARGRCSPILVERGSATHENHSRWTQSDSMIAAVKRMTGIPILVDASHANGRRDLVHPLTMSGLAAGADGFIVETHPEPDKSLSDADQAYPLDGLGDLIADAKNLMELRKSWRPAC